MYNIIENDKDNIHARTKLAHILIKDKRFKEAEPIVNYLTIAEPTNNYIIQLRIAILKNSANEIKVIEDLIKVLPTKATANLRYLYAKLAKLLRLASNFPEAEIYCHKLLEINPSDYAAMNTLSMIYQKHGKLNEAEKLLITAIEIQQDNPHNYNELGQVYIQLYDKTNAIEFKYKAFNAFIRGLKMAKKNLPLRTEFARFLNSYCDRPNFAKSILEQNIQIDQNHFYSYTELGKLYQKNNQYIEAKEILLSGLQLAKDYERKTELIPLYIVLGNCYFELRQYDEAKRCFQYTIDLKDENWASYLGLAKVFLKLNQLDQYHDVYQVILANLKEIPLLTEFANWLKIHKRIDDSLSVILKAKEINNNRINLFVNTIHAGIILEKIIMIVGENYIDALSFNIMLILKLISECENICKLTFEQDRLHEPSLHMLYRLNLFLRDHVKVNKYLRTNYSIKYKNYLGKLFLANRGSIYAFEGIVSHLKTTRRYRLGIALIRKYGDFDKKVFFCLGQLYTFFGFLENRKELAIIETLAMEKRILVPDYILHPHIELIEQNITGIMVGAKINYNGKDIGILETPHRDRNINYTAEELAKKSKAGTKVFFGLYKVEGRIVANCVEPYFDEIPEDESVLKLLELD